MSIIAYECNYADTNRAMQNSQLAVCSSDVRMFKCPSFDRIRSWKQRSQLCYKEAEEPACERFGYSLKNASSHQLASQKALITSKKWECGRDECYCVVEQSARATSFIVDIRFIERFLGNKEQRAQPQSTWVLRPFSEKTDDKRRRRKENGKCRVSLKTLRKFEAVCWRS